MPEVGTLKLGSLFEDEPTWTSPDFRGWVPADGSTYPLSAFALHGQLSAAYGNGDGTFTVPDLSSFIRLNGSMDIAGDSAVGLVEGHTSLPKHTHETAIKLDATVEVTATTHDSSHVPGQGALHIGAGKVTNPFKYESASGLNLSTFIVLSSFLKPRSGETSSSYKNRLKKWLSSTSYVWSRVAPDFSKMTSAELSSNIDSYFTARTLSSVIMSCDMQVGLENADTGYAEEAGQTYPSHVVLPGYVYVGPRS